MKFDPSKPHGVVIGMDGCAFEQNGQLYTPDGEPFVESVQEELALGGQTKPKQQGNNRKDN